MFASDWHRGRGCAGWLLHCFRGRCWRGWPGFGGLLCCSCLAFWFIPASLIWQSLLSHVIPTAYGLFSRFTRLVKDVLPGLRSISRWWLHQWGQGLDVRNLDSMSHNEPQWFCLTSLGFWKFHQVRSATHSVPAGIKLLDCETSAISFITCIYIIIYTCILPTVQLETFQMSSLFSASLNICEQVFIIVHTCSCSYFALQLAQTACWLAKARKMLHEGIELGVATDKFFADRVTSLHYYCQKCPSGDDEWKDTAFQLSVVSHCILLAHVNSRFYHGSCIQ